MINEIKRRLDSGETVELECIDKLGFLSSERGRFYAPNKAILNSCLVVDKVHNINEEDFYQKISIEYCKHVISKDELKYFRIKDKEGKEMMEDKKKSFDKLMDVAMQALKDGFIHEVGFKDGVIKITDSNDNEEYITYYDDLDYYRERIESLYTETFTLESERDIDRIKNDATIELTNGNKSIVKLVLKDFKEVAISDSDRFLDFFSLKGATVTQDKSNV